ncbi:MAG: hypothetical protein PV344_02960 [Anaplasma sp.]|nr:hypothetical protein [Anaplasma sp.]
MPSRVERDSVIGLRLQRLLIRLLPHDDLVLMTQHSSFPSRASVSCVA